MKKIGIITINDLRNLGNQLQLYAMQKILSEYGEVQNLIWKDVQSDDRKSVLFEKAKHIIRLTLSPFIKKFKRYKAFNLNNKKFIKNHKKILRTIKDFEKANQEFDYFVVGSDQIWNPNFISNKNMFVNLLSFASNEKKVAVAPSIGVETLSDEQSKLFLKYLDGFEKLSCREKSGSMLIEKITGKKVETLIDPTLMLSQRDWENFASKPKFHNETEKYMLVYFLGVMPEVYKYVIHTVSKKYNLKVVNMLDKNSKYYFSNPSEFVYLIKNAELVFTDSFHGSVFSYIFEKPLKIFLRQGKGRTMNTRLDNLVQVLKLDDSVFFKEGEGLSHLFETNYDKSILEKEQKKFTKFLNDSIKG